MLVWDVRRSSAGPGFRHITGVSETSCRHGEAFALQPPVTVHPGVSELVRSRLGRRGRAAVAAGARTPPRERHLGIPLSHPAPLPAQPDAAGSAARPAPTARPAPAASPLRGAQNQMTRALNDQLRDSFWASAPRRAVVHTALARSVEPRCPITVTSFLALDVLVDYELLEEGAQFHRHSPPPENRRRQLLVHTRWDSG